LAGVGKKILRAVDIAEAGRFFFAGYSFVQGFPGLQLKACIQNDDSSKRGTHLWISRIFPTTSIVYA
jgi:hypothetical protein